MQRFHDKERTTETTRYDSETVRQVLVRASNIEQQQAETEALTAAQIETLGSEIGLSPVAVRQALGEFRVGTGRGALQTTQKQITNSQAFAAFAMGFACLLVLLFAKWAWGFVHTNNPIVGNLAVAILYTTVYILPMFSSCRYGWHSRNTMLGMIAGVGVGSAYFVAFCILVSNLKDSLNVFKYALLLMVLSVIAGAVGALARQRFGKIPQSSNR